jgi:hypothetical protein
MSFAIAGIAFAQCPIHQEEMKEPLTVETIGHLVSADGHNLPFRVFSAPDGTTGRIVMARYDSLEDAQKRIDEWTKGAEVTCREQPHQKGDGQQTSDRILAQAISKSDSKTKIFLIIRRDGLDCYLIESSSAQVAMEIESYIDLSENQP